MDVVTSVKGFISTWRSGGEANCRDILLVPHSNPSDPQCRDVLTTTYNTLLFSTLTAWNSKPTLSSDVLVAFLRNVLDNLPSTSSSTKSTNVSTFGDLFIDMIWSISTELDEMTQDGQSTNPGTDKAGAEKQNTDSSKANQTKKNVETDKKTISGIVKWLLEYGILSPVSCRERLDSSLLEATGLIPDKNTFERKEIRTRTGLFYKQNKFNLLREQSEGYSKLTIELTSNLGPSHSLATGRSIEPFSVTLERARPVWEKVHGIIGYFDLDLNRALDIILDVLSVHLSTHYSFFIALLSFSPWRRPESFEDVTPMSTDPVPEQYAGKSLDEILSLARHRPPQTDTEGSRVLAQVLGFKFTYYQVPPKDLYSTAALLIREGFIRLEDLYSHLSPAEADVENAHNAYLREVRSRISAAKMSQLAMAAPLESGPSNPKPQPSAPVEQKKPESTDPPNQKAGILIALLSLGALQPAFWIMSKYPWFVDAHPEIADLVIRIMKVSISPLYDSTITRERSTGFTEPRSRYGATGLVKPPPRKACLTLWAPTPPSTSATDFVFFFPDWSDQIPVCGSLDDLMHVIEPIMKFIGLHVSRDPSFLSKFLRLGRTHILSASPVDPITKKPSEESNDEHPIRQFWYKVLRLYLLPALPLIRGNAVCTVDIWNMIKLYETTARWRLYGEWKSAIYKSHPELRIREVQADRESKGFLRRLSHNTIDSLSGPVAKLAHSNPCIFFSNAVNQIMAYDNLANVVIQALRHVTIMGFDVLVYIILDALSNPNKERVKDDGVNTSDWLQSLASFTGMLFRRYSSDLTPVLKYIVHQLYAGQTTEIIVLRELIWKMAGIEPLPSLSDSQIISMAGGPALRIEAIASTTRGARLDPSDVSLRGPSRLGKALVDNSLALPLLIQVAQQRQSSIFRTNEAPLKSLASLFDSTHGVLLQYLELLTTPSVVPPEDYATKVLPPLGELGATYGICAPVCMQIIRPVLQQKLLAAALESQEKERLASEETEKRLKAALAAKREPSASQSRVASPAIGSSGNTDTTAEAKPSVADNATATTEDIVMEAADSVAVATPTESPWLPELSALFDEVKKLLPQHVYDSLGPGFYTTFWQLSTYDLSPPGSKYDDEVAALKQLLRQEEAKCSIAEKSTDRAKRSTAQSHRIRRERYSSYVQTLTQEYKEQTASRQFTLKRLAREKQHWFSHWYPKGTVYPTKRSSALLDVFLEHCITPRCLLSPMDADFCAQFIKVMHTQGTPGFHTLSCYDKILGDQLKVILFSCSEYEARNYGRFLSGVLTDLYKWHQDEPMYIQDNRSKVGGKSMQHTGFQPRYLWPMPPEAFLKWPLYQKVVRKWYKKIANAFTECVQTGEFMHVYNAIIVLKEILPVFPMASVSPESGPQLDKAMDQFIEKEERGDLKILGKAYSAALKRRESFWASPVTKVPTKVL
ncbi:hypothetical protein K435DRAFT_647314 [Dendrothele bispora CBS 962.96]|uniref:THO complex subunit 2 n=1 Tax=Dendrothele bispora (strain CBS 962.96) TaxID=1314807 RepID=A0A4S8MR75_DENBC|nr:hypothetical protein K435DRAFT_647314 [Dendrothele bispora CBS 962.96]